MAFSSHAQNIPKLPISDTVKLLTTVYVLQRK